MRVAAPRQQIIEWAREISDEQKLKEHFSQLLRDLCQTNSVIFFFTETVSAETAQSGITNKWPGFSLLCKEGWTTLETLQRRRTTIGTRECAALMASHDLGALVAVPKCSHPPSLVVGLGKTESQRPYTFPDMQLLLELVELMDNILTHSRVATHAAHIERMASVTMITRGLAHDLNNLATPISTFLMHMEQRVAAGSLEAIVLNDAKASMAAMQAYIQESLFFTQRLIPRFSSISARTLLGDVARLSHEKARQIDARIVLSDDPDFQFVADPALLSRLLQNLVFNAIDASPQGGIVKIAAFLTTEQNVCLQVCDYGSGLPTNAGDRIFEPYFTTKGSGNERRGLGLGLAICQKITELHRGAISAAKNTPRGTVFAVTFPKLSPATAISEPAADGSPIAPQSRAENGALSISHFRNNGYQT
jgi:signal transduction histidine kinase